MGWTRITEADQAAAVLPAWLTTRMVGLRGRFGLLIATGDVLRVSSVIALNQSSDGTVLLDVLLDHAGVPDGVDTAWEPKHYLGAPVPGATMATVNLAQVVAAVEFVAPAMAEEHRDRELVAGDEIRSIEAEAAPIGGGATTAEASETGALSGCDSTPISRGRCKASSSP
jgi:hypothetical protein